MAKTAIQIHDLICDFDTQRADRCCWIESAGKSNFYCAIRAQGLAPLQIKERWGNSGKPDTFTVLGDSILWNEANYSNF